MADVPSALKDWSVTAASNSPSGTTVTGAGLDDNLRELQAVVRAALAHKGNDIASNTTTDIGAVAGLLHDITGTTTITGLGTVSAGIWKVLKFEGVLTLTHNATSLILLGGQNRVTADGDVGIYFSEGSGNWRELSYVKKGVGGTIQDLADPGADRLLFWDDSAGAFKFLSISGPSISDTTLTTNGHILLEAQTASNAATVDFETGISSTYDAYLLVMTKVIPQTDTADLWVRASTDGGSTYLTTNAYVHARTSLETDGTVTGAGSSGPTDQIVLKGSLGTGTGEHFNGTMTLQNLADTVVYKSVHGTGFSLDSAATSYGMTFFGSIRTTSAVNGIRVMCSTGNINGFFALYGIKKT